MGSGGGKQPKIKKIYVKSKDALSPEKRLEDKPELCTIGDFVYLPFQVRGETVIVKEGIFWRVTNENLQSTAELIGCRNTKNLLDMAGEGRGILYGSLIQGVDDGDGWLRLELKEHQLDQVTEAVDTAPPEHSTSTSSTALSPRPANEPIPVCAIAKVTIPESAIAKVPSDLDHPTSGSSTTTKTYTKVHEPDRSTSTSSGAVVASSASSVEVQAPEKPVGVSPEKVYLREMVDPVVDATPINIPKRAPVADPVADTKPTVFDQTAPKPAGITKELNPFRKETFPLSARSFSSDEGDEGVETDPEFSDEGIPVETPKVAQVAFADVLKEGYERRAHERANWLNSLTERREHESQGPVKTSIVHNPMRTFGVGSRFNETRLAPPALRDPDIFDQVRKWNVEDPRYKARDEMPSMHRPVY